MLAAKEGFHNLIAIIDRNNIQIDGYTENVMPLESLRAKLEAFNWHVIEIDGHSFEEITTSFLYIPIWLCGCSDFQNYLWVEQCMVCLFDFAKTGMFQNM